MQPRIVPGGHIQVHLARVFSSHRDNANALVKHMQTLRKPDVIPVCRHSSVCRLRRDVRPELVADGAKLRQHLLANLLQKQCAQSLAHHAKATAWEWLGDLPLRYCRPVNASLQLNNAQNQQRCEKFAQQFVRETAQLHDLAGKTGQVHDNEYATLAHLIYYIAIFRPRVYTSRMRLSPRADCILHVLFFSAQIGTTKGTGGDVLILEEAAYCDEGFFYETVAPILSVGSASLVAISTLTSEINFYTRLIKMQDPSTGRPLFVTRSIELCCEKCKEDGKSHECVHMLHLVPSWQSQERHRKLHVMMQV